MSTDETNPRRQTSAIRSPLLEPMLRKPRGKGPSRGFGIAPQKTEAYEQALDAAQQVREVLLMRCELRSLLADHLSTVKGLFSRVVNENQWDWAIIAAVFGFPTREECIEIIQRLMELRQALMSNQKNEIINSIKALEYTKAATYLGYFIGELDPPERPYGSGQIYILSTRAKPDHLKIGKTTIQPVIRATQINSATGVYDPFGLRWAVRVSDVTKAENLIHTELREFRMTERREFFQLSFQVAKRRIWSLLDRMDLILREEGTIEEIILKNFPKIQGVIVQDNGKKFRFYNQEFYPHGRPLPASLVASQKVSFEFFDCRFGRFAINLRVQTKRK
jgi:hypothetical protein